MNTNLLTTKRALTMNIKVLSIASIIGLAATISTSVSAESVTVEFKKGEVLCLISSINQENNGALKGAYFKGAFPVSGKLGFEYLATLDVETQLAGDHLAPAFSIIKTPGTQAKDDLNGKYLSEWHHLRKTRPDIWKEMIAREYEIKKDLNFTIDDQIYYQVETFWVQQDREFDFDQYRSEVEELVIKNNGRVVYQAGVPSDFETLGKERAPSHTVITEWKSKKQFDDFSKLDDAKPFRYLGGYNAWLMKPRA